MPQYQILNVDLLKQYKPSEYERLSTGEVVLKEGVAPKTGTVKQYQPRTSVSPAAISGEGLPALPQQGAGGPLGNLRLALRDALNEAGRRRVESKFKQLMPVTEGLPPGSLGGIVDFIRSGVKTPIESIFGETERKLQEEAKFQIERQGQTLDLLGAFAKDGSLALMPDSALLEMGRTAGLSEGLTLAWKARIAAMAKADDATQALQLRKIESEIEENKAQTAAARRSGLGGGISKGEKRDQEVSQYLEGLKGADGFVAPETYQQALRKFIASGGTASNFYSSFPQQIYLTKGSITALPPALQGLQTPTKKSLTPDQQSLINDAESALDQIKMRYGDVSGMRQQIINESIQNYNFDPSPYL